MLTLTLYTGRCVNVDTIVKAGYTLQPMCEA